jgi:hypothetical protein
MSNDMHPKFNFRLWAWTNAPENLFLLSSAELAWFKLFVKEASK